MTSTMLGTQGFNVNDESARLGGDEFINDSHVVTYRLQNIEQSQSGTATQMASESHPIPTAPVQ